jgi:hypothetical protein
MDTTICYNFEDSVSAELNRAREKHATPIRSKHEGLAILEEEFLEVREEVFHGKDPKKLMQELIQLAAMCQRMAEDIVNI